MKQEEIKRCLHYDQSSGLFRWRNARRQGTILPWSIAGYTDPRGYVKIKLSGSPMSCHRLAWIYTHGDANTPEEIDHIDGKPSNNAIDNLRAVARKQNAENLKLRIDNTSGFRGVSFCGVSGKWIAAVRHNKKIIRAGYFDNLKDAAEAAAKKRQELFTHDTGRDMIKLLTKGTT